MKKIQLFASIFGFIILFMNTIVWLGINPNWNEDFEAYSTLNEFNDWEFSGYNVVSDVHFPRTHRFTLVNGMLRGYNDDTFNTIEIALHNSTVSYGTWEFDWYVNPQTGHEAQDGIVFMWTDLSGDDFDLNGKTVQAPYQH